MNGTSVAVGLILISIIVIGGLAFYVQPPAEAYTCWTCGAVFSSLAELNQHLLEAHGTQPPQFQCPYCGEQFSSQLLLDAHILLYHSSQPKKKLIITSSDLAASSDLQTYLSSHSDVEMFTIPQALSQNGVSEPEQPLIASSIENLQGSETSSGNRERKSMDSRFAFINGRHSVMEGYWFLESKSWLHCSE